MESIDKTPNRDKAAALSRSNFLLIGLSVDCVAALLAAFSRLQMIEFATWFIFLSL